MTGNVLVVASTKMMMNLATIHTVCLKYLVPCIHSNNTHPNSIDNNKADTSKHGLWPQIPPYCLLVGALEHNLPESAWQGNVETVSATVRPQPFTLGLQTLKSNAEVACI